MDNILYFGFTFEKFDILDFTDDFLAGVRANFFNSGCAPQSNRCTQLIGDNEYIFIYKIEKGSPLSWKINKNGEVCQYAEVVDGNTYRVNTYNKSGRTFKRMYFDFDHKWIRSEYFDKNPDYPDYVLYPDSMEENSVVACEYNSADARIKTFLYPKFEMPEEGDYSALAFTDSGFVFFNSIPDDRLYSKTIIQDSSSGGIDGFSFDSVDFNLNRNFNTTFDIREAEYLDEHNGSPEYVQSNERFNPPVNEFEEKTDDSDLKLCLDDVEPDIVIESAGESYRYFGAFNDKGQRDGKGRTVAPDGKTAYEGGYKDDRRDGFGVFYYKSGSINYVGNWKDNVREGFGIGFRGSDGCAHIGCWEDNFPEGIGARFDGGGRFLFLGRYVDGKKQGKGITLDDDGSFVVSVFRDDEVIASYRIDDLLPE